MVAPHPLSALLSARMERLGLTPPDLATRLAVSDAAVYAWLAGEYRPTPARFSALAEHLGCSQSAVALAAAGIADEREPTPAA